MERIKGENDRMAACAAHCISHGYLSTTYVRKPFTAIRYTLFRLKIKISNETDCYKIVKSDV